MTLLPRCRRLVRVVLALCLLPGQPHLVILVRTVYLAIGRIMLLRVGGRKQMHVVEEDRSGHLQNAMHFAWPRVSHGNRCCVLGGRRR